MSRSVAFGCAISVSLDWAARSWDWWAMILKPIYEVGTDDLQALVDNGVRESKTIEYKLELPGNADSEKAKFLASVSSLANTAGGDHLFGVRASRSWFRNDLVPYHVMKKGPSRSRGQ